MELTILGDPPLAPYNIAIVDDDEVYREFVTSVISADGNHATYQASTGRELCEIVGERQIDCVLLDYHVGDESGFSIKELLHSRFETAPPIVMLTGDKSQSVVITALRQGIADYFSKQEMNPEVLIDAIGRVIEKDRQKHQLEAEHRRLLAAANRDGLTGLANRSAFDEALAREYDRARRDKAGVGLIMLDVDRFKAFNDHYGHPAGDECLIRVAEVIKSALGREGDVPARYGGEEFAIILPGADEKSASRVADRIMNAISGLRLPHRDGIDGVVTVSAGVAACAPDACDDGPQMLLRRADRALYVAKDNGRNNAVSASALFVAPAGR